ncbi:hypothetical protein [Methylocapsa aurea]|jgi:hypothetical protein|uniref:hypothetical protein n=1 Tax=Methylocapsa aurea TaxID=663610 RepID=UPI003D187D68
MRLNLIVDAVDFQHQRLTLNHSARTTHQGFEQAQFALTKHQRSIRDGDAVGRKIEGEGADDHGRRFIALAPPQIGANARHQLIEIEGSVANF